ncbi:PAS domain S-box protein [Thermatribacter velox]|uniref:PAS domain S-box protein n=1 Tax=Thermatribacter velox TaxID=3039681 RepID=A0ABZ2YA66_9BACT
MVSPGKNYSFSVCLHLCRLEENDYQIQDLDPSIERLFSLPGNQLKGCKLSDLLVTSQSNPLFNPLFWEKVKQHTPCGAFDWFFDPPGRLFQAFVSQHHNELCLLLSELPREAEHITFFQNLIDKNTLYIFYRYRLFPQPGFEYVSPSVTAVTGYTPEECYRNPELFFAFIHPEDRQVLTKLLQEGKGFGKPLTLRWQRKSGEIFWVEQLNIPVYDSEGNRIAIEGIARDITGYKKEQEELLQKSRELEWLLKSMINAFVIHEPVFNQEGRLVDFRIVYVNEAYEKMLGLKLEAIRGKTARELWPGMEEEWFKKHEKAILTGIPQSFELYHSPTGRYYRCHIYSPWNTRERYCVVFDDITERKLAEQREAYLKRMLLAIRNVNQLITQEEDPQRLIEKACYRLVETMSMQSALIALFDKNQEIVDFAFCNARRRQEKPHKRTVQEWISGHIDFLLAQNSTLIVTPTLDAGETKLLSVKENHSLIAGKIAFKNQIYGILLTAVPTAYARDEELLDLLKELLTDLGFAMHKIENQKALQEVQRRYQLLADNMPGIVYLCLNDEAWTMVYLNDHIEKITGYPKEEFLSGRLSYAELCHPEDLEPLRKTINEALKERKSFHAIYRLRNRQGEYRFVEEFGGGIWEKGELLYLEGFIQDITERKQYEERIHYLFSHDPLTGLYNRTFLEEEIKRLEENQEFPLGILLFDINGLKLINDALGQKEGNRMLQNLARALRETCPQEALVGRWSGDEFMVILPRTREEKILKLAQEISLRCNQESQEKMPLSVSYGWSIKTSSKQPLDRVINQAVERMHRRKLTENRSARSAIIASLEQSLQETTQETQKHASRIARLVSRIGRKLGLKEDELTSLELLARLHDLGKIAIPLHILNKPGPLTAEEWKIVKKHPEVGYRIAQSSPDILPIAEAILAHHERWDGKGYPQGLKGEQIPLIARILAVVDAYDVMIQGRPYKKAMQQEEAIEELKRCSGTQFDPRVVEVLVKILEEDSGQASQEEIS